MICKNCATQFSGKLCPECGQKASVKRLGLIEFTKEWPRALFNLEQRYWNTIRDFFTNPYLLLKNYSFGKRKYYAAPIQFFFFFATISLLLNALFGIPSDSPKFDLTIDPDSAKNTHLDAVSLNERLIWASEKFDVITNSYSNYFELGIPLIFGLTIFILFFKKFNLAEAFAFSFFTCAIAIEIPSILLVPIQSSSYVVGIELILFSAITGYAFSTIGHKRVLKFLVGIGAAIFSFLFYLFTFYLVLFLIKPFFS